MEEETIEPDFDYWSFDQHYVEEDWRSLSAWKYEGENDFQDDVRVRLSADLDGFKLIPPYQFSNSRPETYTDPDTAYEEAVNYVKHFDVEELSSQGENQP